MSKLELTDADRARIIRKLFVRHLREMPITAPVETRRKMGATAKEIHEDPEMLMALYIELMPELLSTMFGVRHVSLEMSDGTA
jgi:hypothetical protein